MKHFVKAAVVAAAVLAPSVASAQQLGAGAVPFNGTVASTCTITVDPAAGTLGANASFTQLGSTIGGGTSGGASVFSNGAFTLRVANPTLGGDFGTGDTATSSAGLSGATSGTVAGGSQQILAAGTTDVDVDMTANAASVFGPGTYSATVQLTCEQ